MLLSCFSVIFNKLFVNLFYNLFFNCGVVNKNKSQKYKFSEGLNNEMKRVLFSFLQEKCVIR